MNTNDLNDPMDQNFSNAEDTRATSTESESLKEQAKPSHVDDEEIDVTLQPIDLEEEPMTDDEEDDESNIDEEEGEKCGHEDRTGEVLGDQLHEIGRAHV